MWLRTKIRPVLAAVIVVAWLAVELLYGINDPTLELRLMLVSALVWMFGESVKEAVDIVRGGENDE